MMRVVIWSGGLDSTLILAHELAKDTRYGIGVHNVKAITLAGHRQHVLSVDLKTRTAEVSWNGNQPKRWYERDLRKLRRFAPEWMRRGLFGSGPRWRCYHCNARTDEKDTARHVTNCPHPKAVAFRKKTGST